jgi:hypothetical protein
MNWEQELRKALASCEFGIESVNVVGNTAAFQTLEKWAMKIKLDLGGFKVAYHID